MQVKFWEPAKQYLKHKEELDVAIQDVLISGNWVLGAGNYVEKFEQEFAEFVGKKHAIMVRNGTSALYLVYRALLKPGDEVIVPSNTFIATIDQLVAVGAVPILVDCDEDGIINYFEISEKTRAVVPVHMEGKVARAGSDLLHRLSEKGIYVIEDAAQAIGAEGVGSGIAQCYSLFPAKILGSFGNAGIVTTDDSALAMRLKMLRCNSNIGKNPNLDAELGMNMEPDNRDAAWLSVKLKYLPKVLGRRKEIAWVYDQALEDLPISLPLAQKGRVYQDYMILYKDRDKIQSWLKSCGIEALVPNPRIPNHHYTAVKKHLPNTDSYVFSKLALPCNDTITDEEVNHVIASVREFFATK